MNRRNWVSWKCAWIIECWIDLASKIMVDEIGLININSIIPIWFDYVIFASIGNLETVSFVNCHWDKLRQSMSCCLILILTGFHIMNSLFLSVYYLISTLQGAQDNAEACLNGPTTDIGHLKPQTQWKMDWDRLGKAVKSRGRLIISELLEAQIKVYLTIWPVF